MLESIAHDLELEKWEAFGLEQQDGTTEALIRAVVREMKNVTDIRDRLLSWLRGFIPAHINRDIHDGIDLCNERLETLSAHYWRLVGPMGL